MMCSSRCVNHFYPDNALFRLIVFTAATALHLRRNLAALSEASKETHQVLQKQQREVILITEVSRETRNFDPT